MFPFTFPCPFCFLFTDSGLSFILLLSACTVAVCAVDFMIRLDWHGMHCMCVVFTKHSACVSDMGRVAAAAAIGDDMVSMDFALH